MFNLLQNNNQGWKHVTGCMRYLITKPQFSLKTKLHKNKIVGQPLQPPITVVFISQTIYSEYIPEKVTQLETKANEQEKIPRQRMKVTLIHMEDAVRGYRVYVPNHVYGPLKQDLLTQIARCMRACFSVRGISGSCS